MAGRQDRIHCVLVVSEKVHGVFECEHCLETVFRPQDVFKLLAQVDSADHIEVVPVVERDEVFAFDTEQTAAVDAFVGERSFECFVLAEVPVNLHGAVIELDGERVSLRRVVRRPDKISTWAESSILELGESIDYEVVVADDSKVAASRCEFDALSECFTLAKLLHVLWLDQFAILGSLVCTCEQLEIESKQLSLLYLHDLSVCESRKRLFFANLNDDCSFVKAKSYSISLRDCSNRPDSLQTVWELSCNFE